jgi:hypothetical protein
MDEASLASQLVHILHSWTSFCEDCNHHKVTRGSSLINLFIRMSFDDAFHLHRLEVIQSSTTKYVQHKPEKIVCILPRNVATHVHDGQDTCLCLLMFVCNRLWWRIGATEVMRSSFRHWHWTSRLESTLLKLNPSLLGRIILVAECHKNEIHLPS